MQMGADLLDSVETGLAFDYVLVLLSPDSTEPVWSRKRWESILFEQAKQLRTRIAFVLLSECKFPAVLRKEKFFDLWSDFTNGRRAVKRWLLAELTPRPQSPKLPVLSAELAPADIEVLEPLADWPDFAQAPDRDTALAFAYARHGDFEAVAWLHCTRRGRVGVLGDVAHALALRLEGTWEDNAQALREYCAEHRVLLLFENLDSVDPELVNLGGRASILLV